MDEDRPAHTQQKEVAPSQTPIPCVMRGEAKLQLTYVAGCSRLGRPGRTGPAKFVFPSWKLHKKSMSCRQLLKEPFRSILEHKNLLLFLHKETKIGDQNLPTYHKTQVEVLFGLVWWFFAFGLNLD